MSDSLGGINLFFSGALLVRLQIPPIEGASQQNTVDTQTVCGCDLSQALPRVRNFTYIKHFSFYGYIFGSHFSL